MYIFQTTAKEGLTLTLSLEFVRIHMRNTDVEAKNDTHTQMKNIKVNVNVIELYVQQCVVRLKLWF